MLKVKKVGGIWFIRAGRFGGSMYLARAKPVRKSYGELGSLDWALIAMPLVALLFS